MLASKKWPLVGPLAPKGFFLHNAPMQEFCSLADGRPLGIWVARPQGTPKGCLVVLHEAFGVTPHMERVCAEYAREGYLCAAPAMLMHASGQPVGVVLPQNKEGLDEGRRLIMATPIPMWLAMMQAVVNWAAAQGLSSATLGYCWGGSCAYLGGAQIPELKAAICYYGGMLAELTAQGQPQCPTLVHLATEDRYIPLEATLKAFAHYHPAASVHVYEADHGFNRDDGKTFERLASSLAKARTLEILNKAFT
jgi:carboxymethylenebutenolidase